MLNIVLVHPDIPQNTGNVGRLCVALNATLHLVHPMSFVIDDRRVRRAGLDYWKDLDLRIHDSLDSFRRFAEGRAWHLFTTKSPQPYTSARFHEGDFLVFGSESRGLPEEFLRGNWDRTLTIPLFGPVRSLNLSTSAGIAAYEAVRQIRG